MVDLFRIGVITSTHGLKGEVKVFPTTDDINRLPKHYQLFCGRYCQFPYNI